MTGERMTGERMPGDRLWLRTLGLAVLLVSLATFDTSADSTLQRLVMPIVMAAAAWALVQNLAAVAIGTTVLAIIHSDPGASDWVSAIAYPLTAAISLLILAVIFIGRFRRRVQATREARWANRSSS